VAASTVPKAASSGSVALVPAWRSRSGKFLSTAAALICSTIQTRRGNLGALIVALTPLAAVIPAKDKLTDDEKSKSCAMSRPNLQGQNLPSRAPKKPLEYDFNRYLGQGRLAAPRQGDNVAARVGDQIKITHVNFEGSKLVLEINGGLKERQTLV